MGMLNLISSMARSILKILAILKPLSIYVMGLFYAIVGYKHFQDPEWFIQIVPPILPFKLTLVYISGLFEILLGILLMVPAFQSIAARGLIILLICVYPANIYLALTNGAAMNISPEIAWGRLPFQFVFLGLAYWHSKDQ
tara:strand:- start:251 stop:670 length:420 start_codon:yes stop_codon:yes gene_type:complete